MGSHFVTAAFPKSSEADLRAAYGSYVKRQLHEHGHDPYAGTLATCDGLRVEDRTFPDERPARDWIDGVAVKWGEAIAVKIAKVPPYRDTEDARRRRVAVEAAEKALRTAEQRADAVRSDIVRAAIGRKSRTAKCRPCGSAIALAHVRSLSCPVCGDRGFLLTPTAKRRVDAADAKAGRTKTALQAAREALAAGERAHVAANAKPGEFYWLVGGHAAS